MFLSLTPFSSSFSLRISSSCSSLLNFIDTLIVSSCCDILLSIEDFFDSWSYDDFSTLFFNCPLSIISLLYASSSSFFAYSFCL